MLFKFDPFPAIFQRLNTKIVVYFILFAIFPLLIFSLLGYFLNKELITDINTDHLRSLNRSSVRSFTLYMDLKNQALRHALSEYTSSGKTASLQTYLDTQPELDSLFVQVKVSAAADQNNPDQRANGGDPARRIAIAEQLYENKRITGFVPIDEISDLIDQKVKDIQNFVYFLNIKKIIDASGQGHYSEQDKSRLAALLDQPDRQVEPLQLSASSYMTYHTKIPGRNVVILTAVDPGVFYAELNAFRNKIILANLIFALIMVALAVISSQRITTPIHRLIEAVQHIGHGNLEKQIEIQTRDEIEVLANEFELMRQKLQESYLGMEEKIRNRTRELQEAQAQISHQEKMASLGMMAAGIAHEIGNPLTSISSMVQVIKRKNSNELVADYVSKILKNIERISRIVRELVDFSRPSSYEEAPADVNEIIKSAVGIIRYDRRSKNLTYELNLDPDLAETVLVADHLLQVFLNILINAVDASEGVGKIISVSSVTKNGAIQVQISDQGSGIPEGIQQKIFEPFFTTKEVGKGTGLGLTVSYGFIKNLRGDIKVKSKVGKGSTFILSIPIKSKIEEKDEVQNINR
jgi:signal transduction histidine kinase